MRLPGIALALAFVFAATMMVVAIRAGRGGEPGYEPLEVHPLEPVAERAVAGVGLRYARAMQRRDAAAACRSTADPLALARAGGGWSSSRSSSDTRR
jgi:hypothetical protein